MEQLPELPRRAERSVPPSPSRRLVSYAVGLALGAIPLVLLLFAIGGLAGQLSVSFLILALLTYLLSIVAAIVCLFITPTRFVGYGLLTMVFVTPIVAYISCVALYQCSGRYCTN